jgi:ABC-type Fe3+-hydroxamate transport system substrate-binding protein
VRSPEVEEGMFLPSPPTVTATDPVVPTTEIPQRPASVVSLPQHDLTLASLRQAAGKNG